MSTIIRDWRVALVLILAGAFFIFRGTSALKTGKYYTRWGTVFTGKAMKIASFTEIVFGGALVIVSIIGLILIIL